MIEDVLPLTDDITVEIVHICLQQLYLLALHLEIQGYIQCLLNFSGSEVIKRFFILNSAVHESCLANKSQITNNYKSFLQNIAEHETFC